MQDHPDMFEKKSKIWKYLPSKNKAKKGLTIKYLFHCIGASAFLGILRIQDLFLIPFSAMQSLHVKLQ